MIVAIKHDTLSEIMVTYVSAPSHVDVTTERTKWLRWLKEWRDGEWAPVRSHIDTPVPREYISLHDWLIRAGCTEPSSLELQEIWDD